MVDFSDKCKNLPLSSIFLIENNKIVDKAVPNIDHITNYSANNL
jgi:hypothetical protein